MAAADLTRRIEKLEALIVQQTARCSCGGKRVVVLCRDEHRPGAVLRFAFRDERPRGVH